MAKPSTDNPNLEIYQKAYTVSQLTKPMEKAWDKTMADLRFSLLDQHAHGGVGLDLCCGPGFYGAHLAERVDRFAGLDISHDFLKAFAGALGDQQPAKPFVMVQADCLALPLSDASVDVLCSYCSLYYMPDFERLYAEIHRVLKPGGVAILELGNRKSLSFPLAQAFHKSLGWAKAFAQSVPETKASLAKAGLSVLSWRSFQLLPMYGAPPGQRLWLLVSHPKWKSLMAKKIGGKMLDEWLSSLWPLRQIAWRHLVVVTRS